MVPKIKKITKRLEVFCKRSEIQIGKPCVELVFKILVTVGHPVEEILRTEYLSGE